MKKHILLIAVLVGTVFVTVQAEIMAEYTFTGASAVSTDSHTGTTAGDYTYPDGFGGISSVAYDKYVPASLVAGTLADSIAGNDYDSITITHNSGTWEWTTFDFEYKVQNIWSDFTVYLLVDADANGWDAGDEIANFRATGTTGATVVNDVSFDISSLADLASDSVEFHLYYTDNSGGGDRLHRVDNVSVNAIPEPATLGLLTCASGAIFWIRRQFRI